MIQKILFTHDDLDGAGCRVIFEALHHHLEKEKDYLVVNCGNATINDDVKHTLDTSKDQINRDTEILFADIVATSNEYLGELKKKFKNIGVWDHHRTNFPCQAIIPNAQIIPENKLGKLESGTSLLFHHFAEMDPDGKEYELLSKKYNQELIGTFVDCVRSYDTYEWKETNNRKAKELQILFLLLGMEYFCNKYVKKLTDPDSDNELITENDMEFVLARLNSEQRTIDNFTKDDVYEIDIRGHKTAFIPGYVGANISELAHQFLKKYPEFDLFCGYYMGRSAEFSFRTIRDDFDTGAEIASVIGGGGHPKASGAPLKVEHLDHIIHILVDALNE